MTPLILLPFIAMACIYLVVIANLPYKLSKWLSKKGIVYNWLDVKKKEKNMIFCIFDRSVYKQHCYREPIDLKFISCESCLTWWISLFYLILHTDPFQAIILAGATAYLTAPLKRLL